MLDGLKGRWRLDGLSPMMNVSVLDIGACGDALCGRAAGQDCGAILFRLEAEGLDVASGTLLLDGRPTQILVRGGERLQILASSGASPWSRRSMPLIASFVADGASRCGQPTS